MGPHGTHLGPTGPSWVLCWPHELCYSVSRYISFLFFISQQYDAHSSSGCTFVIGEYVVNGLALQGAKASTANAMTQLSRDITVSVPEGNIRIKPTEHCLICPGIVDKYTVLNSTHFWNGFNWQLMLILFVLYHMSWRSMRIIYRCSSGSRYWHGRHLCSRASAMIVICTYRTRWYIWPWRYHADGSRAPSQYKDSLSLVHRIFHHKDRTVVKPFYL